VSDSTEYVGFLGLTDSNTPTNYNSFHTKQHLAHVRTGGPVKVIAVNQDGNGNYTVDVQPLVKQVDGVGNPTPHGTIYGIPLHAVTGKNGSSLVAPTVGDKGWVHIGDRDHSSVLASGGEANPGSRRMHDWSDGYYLGGFGSLNTPNSSIVQDANGITHKTNQNHSFTATNTHTINAKAHNVNAPTNGMNVQGNLNPTGTGWNLGSGGSPWNGGTVQNAFTVISDAREKIVNDKPPLGLEFIRSLRPVSFKWKDGGKRQHWGLLAQQVKAVCDAAGVDFGGWVLADAGDPESRQGLRYEELIAPLIKAVQELTERIETLELKPTE
jgi:hypothetical protein